MTTLVFFLIGWGLLFVLLLLLPSIFNRKVTATLAAISGLLALFVIATEMFVSWQTAVGAGLLLTVVTSFLTARRVEVLDDEKDGEEASAPALYEPVSRHDPEPESKADEVVGQADNGDSLDADDDAADESHREVSREATPAMDEPESSDEPIETSESTDEHVVQDSFEETPDQKDAVSLSEEADETPDEAEGESPRRFVVEAIEEDDADPADTEEEDEGEEEAGASRLMHKDGESSLTERRPLNEDDEEPIMRRSSSIDVEEFSEEADESGTPAEEAPAGPEETAAVTDPHDVNEKRKRLFEALADEDDDEAGGHDK